MGGGDVIRALFIAIGIVTAGVAWATPAMAVPGQASCAEQACAFDEPMDDEDEDDGDTGDGAVPVIDWGMSPYVTVCAGVDSGIPFVEGELCTG